MVAKLAACRRALDGGVRERRHRRGRGVKEFESAVGHANRRERLTRLGAARVEAGS